jgi:hypothetical protein
MRQKAGGRLSSGEVGRSVTLVVCVNASGQFIPPLFVFLRVNFNQSLMFNAPSEVVAVVQQSGWLNLHLSAGLMEFVRHVHHHHPVLF